MTLAQGPVETSTGVYAFTYDLTTTATGSIIEMITANVNVETTTSPLTAQNTAVSVNMSAGCVISGYSLLSSPAADEYYILGSGEATYSFQTQYSPPECIYYGEWVVTNSGDTSVFSGGSQVNSQGTGITTNSLTLNKPVGDPTGGSVIAYTTTVTLLDSALAPTSWV